VRYEKNIPEGIHLQGFKESCCFLSWALLFPIAFIQDIPNQKGLAMNQTDISARQYPGAMVKITNRCTLRCKHWLVYCCYGNDVDCDFCGAGVVFWLAAKLKDGSLWSYPISR
jgi:hypothetical protein